MKNAMRFFLFVAALLGCAHVPVHGAAAALPPFNLALTLNDGVGEVVYAGWPLVLRGDAVLMEEVSAPFPLDPASLKLTISSVQGAPVNWPLRQVTQFSSSPVLGPQNENLRVTWVLDSAQTRDLAPGRYVAEFAWAGRTSSPLGFSVAAPPATLSANDEVRRALLESQSAQLRGDAAAAMTALDGVGQRFPESIDVLLQRALVHLDRGQHREAMRATQQARVIYNRDHPNESHPPFAILAVEAKARDTWLKNVAPGPPIPGLPTGPGRTGSTAPVPNPSGGALPPPAAPAPVAPPPATAPAAAAGAPPATTASPSRSLVTLNVNLNLGGAAAAGTGAAPAPDPGSSVIRGLPSATPGAAPVAAAPAASAPEAVASAGAAGPAIASGVVPAAHVTDAKSQSDPAGQWAASARAGSQYGTVERSAARATGEPDVPGADDHPNAWCPATRDRGTDWLELTFARAVPATEVRVRQNHGPGAITKVEAIEPNGRSHVWWEGVDPYGQDGSARDAVWFTVRVPRTAYAVQKIKLTLNLAAHTRWKQIDAVQLIEAQVSEVVVAPVQVPVSVASTAPVTAPAAAAAPLPTGVVPAVQLNDALVQADVAGQWATSARASSQFGPAEGSAARATGAPDVPGADDHPNAWCPATRDRGVDWLELTFARPVRASEVRVRQNNGPGAITKVEAIDTGGQTHVWWEGVDPYGQDGFARTSVWFAVRVQPTSYSVAKIKLTLNLGAHTRWKQIDAVQLVEAPLTLSGISSPAAPPATPPSSPATAPAPAAGPAPAAAAGSPVPAPPASPLNSLVRKLTEKRAAGTAGTAPRKEDLLKPEFRFRRGAEWLVLPALARQLSTNDTERIAVLDLLTKGVTETSRLLAAEGADNDIAAATALYFTQLWGVARQREVPEAGADKLHAQIVAALAGPEVAAMSDADKQRYWEYCLGLPIFVLGMREVATEPAAQADLRTIAAAAFEVLLGVRPELVDIGNEGLKLAAGVEEALNAPADAVAPAAPAPGIAPSAGSPDSVPRGAGAVAAVAYAAPAGWSREDANWATIVRATLGDLNHLGQPDVNSDRKHQAAIFVLPPRAAPQGPAALFEPMWRQEFGGFELGDAVVHYRSRLKSGLVVHFMGRFFNRPNQDNRENQTYAVMYLVDLGDRVQPITATLVPGKSMFSMTGMNENEGLRALSAPLGAFLDSIQPAGGAAAPYPAGGLFAPSEIRGNWTVSRSAFGGMYVYAATGASAGAVVAASSNSLDLRDDGSFVYKFAGYFQNPVVGAGGQVSTDNNDGRYTLEGDVIRFTPRLPRSYRYDRCAVGVGTVRTPEGVRRIVALVGANTSGVFRGPPLIPVGSNYDGLMDWFVEEPRSNR